MLKQYTALSVVAPSAERIVQGQKTLEIRSWQPQTIPLKNLVIVENQHFLRNKGEQEIGRALALVDIESIHVWQADEIDAACAS
jgi:predicted transcriptional regulator